MFSGTVDEYNKIIYPWHYYYDDNWQRYYFYNTLTNESVWELPEDVQEKLTQYNQLREETEVEMETKNISSFITVEQMEENRNKEQLIPEYMKRPARKQVERSLAADFSYKQGDEEYNLWYDKFLTDSKFKDREPAPTRCDPDLDSGYTKADYLEKFSTYFCIHFARGCCCEGVNCTYFHRVPTLEECEGIDHSRDIFGRSRFANHREDMSGIGSFLKECRLPPIKDSTTQTYQMYETLWRHFSIWGEIEDINLVSSKGLAFVKYRHRCMAEYGKEALQNRALDEDEIITIKWANDDQNPKKKEKNKFDDENQLLEMVIKKENQKKKQKREKHHKEIIEEMVIPKMDDEDIEENEIETGKKLTELANKKKEIEDSCYKMSEVLKRIEQMNEGTLNEEEDNSKNKFEAEEDPTGNNDQPLFFK